MFNNLELYELSLELLDNSLSILDDMSPEVLVDTLHNQGVLKNSFDDMRIVNGG